MSEDRVEAELRAWLAAHTEPDAPDSLRAFLTALPGEPAALDRVRRPGAGSIRDHGRRDVLRVLVACAVIVLVVAGLEYGLSQRQGPAFSPAPSPSHAQPSPVGSTPPPGRTATPVVDAAPIDADHGWALTHDDLVWTDDAGASWTSIRPAEVVASSIRAVHFLSGISGWLAWWSEATSAVTVERTSDGGHTWRASNTPGAYPDGVGNVSIEAVSGGTVWIQVEAVHSSASSIGGLFLSLDGGISWVPGIDIPGGWPVRFVSRSDGWTFAGPLRDQLEVTHDSGRTWRRVNIDLPPGHAQDTMSFDLPTFTGEIGIPGTGVLPVTLFSPADPTSADQAATLAIYTTDDGGATWQFATAIGMTTARTPGVTMASMIFDQQTWLVASEPGPLLSRTKDGGRVWVDVGSVGLDDVVDRLRFVDAGDGWALTQSQGSDFVLSATSDGGRTWRLLEPVAQATVGPSPNASAATGPYRWTLLTSEGDIATYPVLQAIRRRDGAYVAIALGQEARILSSPDGRTWTVEPGDAALLESSANHLSLVSGIAEGSNGFVAVGATALDDMSSGDARAWASSDGIHWRAAAPADGTTDAAMEAVTAGPDGYVAVGSDGFPGGNVQLPGARGAAVWTSSDGTTWTRVPGLAAFEGAIMTEVRRLGTSYVAWGETFRGRDVPGTGLPPVWASSDGIRWDRSNGIADADGPGAPIASITLIGNRLVAVGSRRLPDAEGGSSIPGAWTSGDGGRTWRSALVTDDPADARRPGRMSEVAVDGSDLVAVGRLEPAARRIGPGTAAVWRSTDQGSTWTRLPDDPSFDGVAMRHVLSRGPGLVVFGQADDPDVTANAALIWVAESSR